MWGQVTRSGQVTQLQNNFPIAPRLQCFRESYETFRIWWAHQCLQNLYLGFLISVTSGQVILRPPHYKSMGKNSTPLYLLWRKPIWVESYRIGQLWTIRVKMCIAYPSKGHLRSPEVTNRHLPITFDQKEIETWDWCQYVRLGQANPMICNMIHFGHHVTLARLDLRSNFDLDLSVILYMVRRVLTRQTRWCQIRCSTSKINDFIVEKPFWKILEFWPLVTSILSWAKKWPKWFRNDFSRAFERCLSFFSTATRSRDHGGAFKRPPPPSRRWKIQRPSRARVKEK